MSAVLDAARAERAKRQAKLDELLAKPTEETRALTDDEAAKFEEISKRIDKLDRQIAGFEADVARREKAAAAEAAMAPKTRAGEFVVRSEPGVYRRDASPRHGEPSYLRDLAAFMVPGAQSLGDPESAHRRLQQNWTEVQRDADQGEHKAFAARIVDEVRRWGAVPDVEARVNPNTTAGTGGEFVPPLWLVSQYAPLLRADRVCANRVSNQALPPGIDIINLPKITTGSLTGVQAANAAPVASRDIVTSTVSAKVNTISGQEDISLQLLEQSPIAMDGVVFDDLARDYSLQLDVQVLYGSGVNGQHQGVLTQTNGSQATTPLITQANAVTVASAVFADASTTGTINRSLGAGKLFIEQLRIAPATAIWAHPRQVLHWEVIAFDTQGRPLFVPYSPFNAFGLSNPNVPEGVAGALLGLPVVKDGNIPINNSTSAINTGGTNDVLAVVRESDLILWEGTLRMRALPEILSGTLQIRYQVYAYSAFMPNRFPPSTSILLGAGLNAPTF